MFEHFRGENDSFFVQTFEVWTRILSPVILFLGRPSCQSFNSYKILIDDKIHIGICLYPLLNVRSKKGMHNLEDFDVFVIVITCKYPNKIFILVDRSIPKPVEDELL